AAVPVLALLAYGFKLNPRDVPSPLVGRTAAPFFLTAFDGTPVELGALRGKVVVVNFWASWCNPACYEEAPVLERGWRAYRERGVVVLGVDIQDTDEAAQKFINAFGLTFKNSPDRGGKISVDYAIFWTRSSMSVRGSMRPPLDCRGTLAGFPRPPLDCRGTLAGFPRPPLDCRGTLAGFPRPLRNKSVRGGATRVPASAAGRAGARRCWSRRGCCWASPPPERSSPRGR